MEAREYGVACSQMNQEAGLNASIEQGVAMWSYEEFISDVSGSEASDHSTYSDRDRGVPLERSDGAGGGTRTDDRQTGS